MSLLNFSIAQISSALLSLSISISFSAESSTDLSHSELQVHLSTGQFVPGSCVYSSFGLAVIPFASHKSPRLGSVMAISNGFKHENVANNMTDHAVIANNIRPSNANYEFLILENGFLD